MQFKFRLFLSIMAGLLILPMIFGPVECGNSGIKEAKSMIIEKKSGENTVKINLSKQVLYLDVPEEKDYDNKSGKVEAPIYPTLKELMEYGNFMSASIISAKAKQFDDGLYAAVDLGAENGKGNFRGKKLLLSNLLKAMKKMDKDKKTENARALLLAAAILGGQKIEDDKEIASLAESFRAKFLGNELRAKPIGFYTWNKELKEIFQQDRLLQAKLDGKDEIISTGMDISKSLATGLINSGKETKELYGNYVGLTEKLTNGLAINDLRPLVKNMETGKNLPDGLFAFFPPSRAYETDLIKKLYGNSPIPDGFNLADKLIEEIKAGKINLTPKKNSGWYDYQTYAMEPLVTPEKFPEAKKLEFSKNYKKELLQLFKSLLALTRETHIKQLEIPTAGSGAPMEKTPKIEIDIYPDLSLEPLATYYLRRARSYTFVHKVLIDTFGEKGLKDMYRLTATGPVKKNLHEELKDMESLFYGAAMVVASETGCKLDMKKEDGSGRGQDEDLAFAREWLKNPINDKDVMQDNRMMVPVFYDIKRKMTKVWVVIGYEVKPLKVEFKSVPDVTVYDKTGKKIDSSQLEISYNNTTEKLIYPIFAEIYVKKILNRDEFRALCNKYKTRSEIIKALENLK